MLRIHELFLKLEARSMKIEEGSEKMKFAMSDEILGSQMIFLMIDA